MLLTSEELPRQILIAAAWFISGFILSLWCMPLIDKKPRMSPMKPGFSVTLHRSQLKNPVSAVKLAGKTVRILRTETPESEPCVIDHIPMTFQMQDQIGFLTAGIETLENFVIHVSAMDLRAPDLIEASSAQTTQVCRHHPRVTYGE